MTATACIVTYLASDVPLVRLPGCILYSAVLYAILLSLMVFVWIWVNTLDDDVVGNHRIAWWIQRRMLVLSQKAGLVLVGGVAVKLFF